MHKKQILGDESVVRSFSVSLPKFKNFIIMLTVLLIICRCDQRNNELPTKIFEISKSDQEIPIILLSDLSPSFQHIILILDSGSSQLALFDNRCQSCINTFAACPHIKTLNNQTLITYLLTKFKGDFSYLTLTDQLRIRFFCVLEADQNFNSLQTNGILGVKSSLTELNGGVFIQGNGVKIWRKIIHKIYEQKLNQIRQTLGQQRVFQRLTYSIFYSNFHTQMILGSLPGYLNQNFLASYSLKEKIIVNELSFFKEISINKKKEQFIVHFDTGSSVIVVPMTIFQQLFQHLTLQVSRQCVIVKSLIQCPKNVIQKLVQLDSKFRITLMQKENSSQNEFHIELQNLIQNNDKENQRMFSFKIYGHQSQNQKQEKIIILGVPFFKQYLIQFEIPFDITEKVNFVNNNIDINKIQKQQEYRLKIYDPHTRVKQQLLSPYEHLMKKQIKNVKILLFTYFCFVIMVSYLLITIYWWIYQFIYGKRSIV